MTTWDYLTLFAVTVAVAILAFKTKAFTKGELPQKEQMRQFRNSRYGGLVQTGSRFYTSLYAMVVVIGFVNVLEAAYLMNKGSRVIGCRGVGADIFQLYSTLAYLPTSANTLGVLYSCSPKLLSIRQFTSPYLFMLAVCASICIESALAVGSILLLRKIFLRWS